MTEEQSQGDKLKEFAVNLRHLKDTKVSLTRQLAETNKAIESLVKGPLLELMSDLGLDQAVVTGVGTLKISADIYVNIKAANKDAAKEWLVGNGYEDLITETINASTLKAWAKEFMKREGELPPEEIFNVTPYEFVNLK